MSRPTKAMVEQAYQNGYACGLELGRKQGRLEAEKALDQRKALIQLVSVVGQTLQSQNNVVESLARVLDNSVGLQ